MINKDKLKAKITENGYSREKIAEILGISPTSLNYKLNEKRQFKANEILILGKVLKIKDKDLAKYFFISNAE